MSKFNNLNKNWQNQRYGGRLRPILLKDKDFTDIKYKFEIQDMFATQYGSKGYGKAFNYIFLKALKNNSFGMTDVSKMNRLISELKATNQVAFNTIVQSKFEALGPGEVLLFLLHDNIYLAGGSEGGDVRIGTKKYEVKGCTFRQKESQLNGFFLGSTVGDKKVLGKISELAMKYNITKSSTSVKTTDVDKLRKNHAEEYLPLEKEYADITIRDYFSKYGFIFIGTKGITGGKYGKIVQFFPKGGIKADMITLDGYSRNAAKPFIKVRGLI
jgi:hypothetical protein